MTPLPAQGASPTVPAVDLPEADAACRVCGRPSRFAFRKKVMEKHDVAYFDCAHCGYLQTEAPHWLDEAYAAPINASDTGILERNRTNVGRVLMTLLACRRLHGRVVDHAGGYGILVRLLRDAGVDAWWSDKYCQNLLAPGFEAADGERFDLLTAFEAFEHLVDPVAELRTMLQRAPQVLLSTDLVRRRSEPLRDWWYLGTHHGQHIGFLRESTLAFLARELDCHCLSDGRSIHLFTRDPAPRLWRQLQRRHRLGPLVARLTLRSRTRSDEQRHSEGSPHPAPETR